MPPEALLLDATPLTLSTLTAWLAHPQPVRLAPQQRQAMQHSRQVVEALLKTGRPVYGVNTGFGKFAEVRIPQAQVGELQRRLVLSHAAGVGPPMPREVVRLMLLLKARALAQGYSGCRPEVVDLLLALLNHDILPVVPSQGSVGASGDLAPLAHLALVLLGQGEAWQRGDGGWQRTDGGTALRRAGLQPLCLEAKEGLALLNGTQAMAAYLVWTLGRARTLLKVADLTGAISLEALLGTLTAFDARIQQLRPHPGQQQVAANVRRLLAASPIVASHRFSDHKVQDAYSLRCIPQVHGAVRDAVAHVADVVEREINAVTDNPLVFAAEGEVLSGGNFHGEPLALAADYLAIALSELASIAERRIAHLLDPALSELPGFLVPEGGLNSGFMLAQVTAAALVSENKVLAHPASVDSIPTSANKEDHVSMGLHAARKAAQIADNLEQVLAIELLCGVQALDLRAPLAPAPATAAVRDLVRRHLPFWQEDRLLHRDLEVARQLVASGQAVQAAEAVCGPLA
ncbi:MAG: histidine ammonia-lyase [Candidatus Tectimicrobiota bacterium]|nr:MAG: histidine ammonia-lyase [Candidatus Tectomicrobia bacterium]